MKNICKKLIIMFVMVLGIMGGYSINAFADDDFEIGVSNLNGTTENSAKVGEQLLKPEIGWRRYDEKNYNIMYSGAVSNGNPTGKFDCYNDDYKCVLDEGSYVSFNFLGSKIRIIGAYVPVRSKNILVEIDGVAYRYDANSDVTINQCLVFQKIGLENKDHTVKITIDSSTTLGSGTSRKSFDIDAIDIDNNGELLPYKEIENPETPDDDETKKAGALLIINLVDGETKIYDVSSSECQKFLDWYDDNNDKQTYKFKKEVNSSINIDEYVVHDKITHFEIRKY